MATKAHKKIQNALLMSFAATAPIAAGMRVKLASDSTVTQCGAGEDGIGNALNDAVANEMTSIVLDGHAIVPVKVGTGGATRGLYADFAADGWKDRVIADGTSPRFLGGKFMQTGVVGDIVGLMIGIPTPTATA